MLTLLGSSTFNGTSQKVGVTAANHAQVVIEDGSVVTFNFSGGQGTGLQVNNSTLSLTNTKVSMTMTNHNVGVNATNGAMVEISGGSVSLPSNGDTNTGLLVNASNLFVTPFTNVSGTTVGTTVSMTGTNDNIGVNAINGATGEISGASVSVAATGDRNMGLTANGSTLSVTGTGVSVAGNNLNVGVNATNAAGVTITDTEVSVTGANNNVGVSAMNASKVTMTDGSISVNTTGSNNIGALATGTGSTATLDGTPVTVSGNGNIGIQADSGLLMASNSPITVTGNNDIGARAQNGGTINASGSTSITVDGNNPTGVQLNNAGTINMVGGSVTTTGTGGQAILVSGTSLNHGTFDGTTVTSENSQNGIGILAQGGNSTMDFFNMATLTPANGINGILLLDQSSGIVNLNGTNNVRFVGDIDAIGAPAPGIVNVTLRENSSLTGAINRNALKGAVDISSFEGATTAGQVTGLPPQKVNLLVDPSTWNMTASSTLDQLEVFPGALININYLETSGSFRTLVARSLTGSGGIFAMNVDLPAFQGDLLVVQTPTAGFNEHHLQIINLNQSQTPQVNRALLVVISAQTSGLEFPSNQVDAGAFKYESRRGDNTSLTPDEHNWYLVRTDQPEPSPIPAPSPTPAPIPPGPAPSPSPTPPGGEGQIDFPKPLDPQDALTNAANAAIGSYSAIMPMFYADMGTLNERLGELRLQTQQPPQIQETYMPPAPTGKGVVPSGKEAPPSPPPPEVSPVSGLDFWIRAFGSGSHFNNQVSRAFDENLGGFQLGADKRLGTAWGDLYLGGFLGYFRASPDFLDGGAGHTDAFSVGAYTTLVRPSGFYADLVIKQTYLWNEFATPTTGEAVSTATANYSLPTFGGSLEIGKRWDIGNFFLEPQGQIMGAWADSYSYNASNGLVVRGESQYSLRGRLGLRTGVRFNYGDKIFEPFASVSVVNEFLGGYTVTTSKTAFNPTLSGASVDAAIGLNARLSRTVYIYGQYEYENSDKVRTPWAVNAGISWQW
jgi:outer membrane autotransporter protein